MIVIVDGVQFIKSENKWKNKKPFIYKGTVIPENFETDFRTTPKIFEWIVSKVIPKYHLAFVWHDYMYKQKTESRLKIDLKEAVYLADDLKECQIILVFIFVRLFGNYYWKKYKKEDDDIFKKKYYTTKN